MLGGCGPVDPDEFNAFYCPVDETIYLIPNFTDVVAEKIGDYAVFTVIGHEWGHHIQKLTGAPYTDSVSYELQADCLSGAFADYVESQRLMDPGDFSEAILAADATGDDRGKIAKNPLGLPTDNTGSGDPHGTGEERIKAFVKRYGGGVTRCGLPLLSVGSAGPVPVPTEVARAPQQPTVLDSPRLPTALPLSHAACFSVVDGGPLTFSQLLDRFSGFPDAGDRLQGWGWQASAYRQFGCDGPPEGEAGWIDISVHGFGSAASAQEAADYFAAARMAGTALMRADGPGIGDYSVALVGPATNGKEFTVYATRGPWLVRVTGVSPSGIPYMDVRTVAGDVLNAQELGGGQSGMPPVGDTPQAPAISSADFLPAYPNVNYAECFRTHSRGAYSAREVDEAFAATGIGASATTTYGWRDGAYVVFRCDDPPFGRARQIDVVIHQFRDDAAANQVLPYVDAFFTAGDHALRACDVAGPLVICVTGYADTGSPLSDVHFVLNQVVAGAR